MGERGPMGNASALIFANDRIFVAGRPHRSRNRSTGARGSDADSRNLRAVHARASRSPGFYRGKIRERTFSRRGPDLDDRSNRAGPESDPGRDIALFRTKLFARE